MPEAEELIVEALSSYGIPPAASRNLIQRARRKNGLGDRPEDWVRLMEGPLLAEIQNVIPIFRMGGAYAEALRVLKGRLPAPAPAPEAPRPRTAYRLTEPEGRKRLLADLAREEGVFGVALLSPGRAELRFPGAGPHLPPMLYAAHRMVAKRRPYRLAYVLVKDAQVFLRPLGEYVVTVVAKRGANLGRILARLAELGLEGGQG